MEVIIGCLSAFIACLGFSLIFRIHKIKFAMISSIGGALGYLIYSLAIIKHDDIFSYFMAMVIVTLFAELAARIFKAPATIFLIIGCFPLVPGRGIYETMLYCTQGKNELFLNSFIHTLAISLSLAMGIIVVSTIFKVIKKLSIQRNQVNS